MQLPLALVRETAEQNGYREVEHNNKSRLLSFREGKSGSTRINVYYTTGTVGTCLNHPRRGKTQLFRRNVNIDALDSIFANPRIHTGEGYYHRNSTKQKWRRENTDEYVCDSARRWQFVGHSTSLVQSDREMRTIVTIVTEWDDLYWDPGSLPHLHYTRFACGSHSALLKMLYEVVRETSGDCRCYSEEEGWMSMLDENLPFYHDCDNETYFLEVHEDDVRRLKRKFLSLRENIRIELMQWFIGRDSCGTRFRNSDGEIFATEYSDAVNSALIEYGELMYPKKAKLCSHCGVVYTDGESPPRGPNPNGGRQ